MAFAAAYLAAISANNTHASEAGLRDDLHKMSSLLDPMLPTGKIARNPRDLVATLLLEVPVYPISGEKL